MEGFDNIYLTGDTHADFGELIIKSIRYGFTKRDLLIILGDVGLNYYGDHRDRENKDRLAVVPCTILCIHGNHEMRPTSPGIQGLYHPIQWMGDTVYLEKEYPRFMMAEDGARYKINGREFLVIGGAYSVDKPWRIKMGYKWFPDEQLTVEEMDVIRKKVKEHGNMEDIILAHTCPFEQCPVECFLPNVDKYTVDNTMEQFLQEITDMVEYNAFYCGHWHTEKREGKLRILFHDVILL